jgi:phage gpG-like protein
MPILGGEALGVTFNDYSDEVLEAFDEACIRALERCGNQAVGYAYDLAPKDTGTLARSVDKRVVDSEPAVYIGTNSEYGAYKEFGTGHYSTIGGGTPKKRWVYMDEEGNWRIGKPQPATPYLKPAVANHVGTYKNIIKDELQK